MYQKKVYLRLSNNKKWMHRIEENLYCCWTCWNVTNGDADHWKSCGEYVHSYIHVFRICIGCYTGIVLDENRCRFKVGDSPGLPLDGWDIL